MFNFMFKNKNYFYMFNFFFKNSLNKLFFLKKNIFKFDYKLKKNSFNYFNLFFTKYFIVNNKNNFMFNINNNKNIVNLLFNFNINNINYLILDNKKYIYNLYLNIFGLKKILIYKNYFFFNNKHFTHKNYIYFYSRFLLNNNIKSVIIFDTKNILNFSHILEKFNVVFIIINDNFVLNKNSYTVFIKNSFYNFFIYLIIFNKIWIISINQKYILKKMNFFKNILKIN